MLNKREMALATAILNMEVKIFKLYNAGFTVDDIVQKFKIPRRIAEKEFEIFKKYIEMKKRKS